MIPKKRLQVFVSSTYTDLQDERQAAVQAILTAGHIPAGMELFAAGDRSQLEVIQRWIDESDVYMLLLGARYGSIEGESGKSYTHLEYEYAVARGKPVFAVVIDDAILDERTRHHPLGIRILERENPQQLNAFRRLVTSRMVRFWRDAKDIKLAILETLSDFSRRDDLRGWIPGDQAVDSSAIAEQIAALSRENAMLREQVNRAVAEPSFAGVPYGELRRHLAQVAVQYPDELDEEEREVWIPRYQQLASERGADTVSLLDVLTAFTPTILAGPVEFVVQMRGDERPEKISATYVAFRQMSALGIARTGGQGADGVWALDLGLTAEGEGFVRRLVVESTRRGRPS